MKELRDFQQESVDNLLEGKDVYLSVKTGGGKSFCYQAFHVFWTEKHGKNGNVLVISPLISIMKEQCNYLNSCGFKATYIGRDPSEDDSILEEGFHIIVNKMTVFGN